MFSSIKQLNSAAMGKKRFFCRKTLCFRILLLSQPRSFCLHTEQSYLALMTNSFLRLILKEDFFLFSGLWKFLKRGKTFFLTQSACFTQTCLWVKPIGLFLFAKFALLFLQNSLLFSAACWSCCVRILNSSFHLLSFQFQN